jgi:hypothetical protein
MKMPRWYLLKAFVVLATMTVAVAVDSLGSAPNP